jgi:hypothetical protein
MRTGIYNNFYYTESEEKKNVRSYVNFISFLYSKLGAGAHQNFRLKPEPEHNKNDAAPQHWL